MFPALQATPFAEATYQTLARPPPPRTPCPPQVFMQLVGYRLFEEVQALFKEKAAKAKAAGAAQPTQQDLFKQLMRPRLPPVSYYVEQVRGRRWGGRWGK